VFAVIVMSVCVRDTWDLSTEHPLNRQHAKNACMTMIGTRSRYERQWVWLFPLHSFRLFIVMASFALPIVLECMFSVPLY